MKKLQGVKERLERRKWLGNYFRNLVLVLVFLIRLNLDACAGFFQHPASGLVFNPLGDSLSANADS